MRTKQIANYIAGNLFAVTPQYLNSLVTTINSGDIAKAETNNDFQESHSYEVIGNVAVITVDGATTKKNTWMNAMCGGFIGYDTIASYIEQAESDIKVTKILFNTDTVGGEVSGVDELAELILGCSKETHTFYSNVGASAGIWWGSASDYIHAGLTSIIGSIGVIGGYMNQEDDESKVMVVSKNAENKNCSLSGDCKDKLQARLDSTEAIFHERVSRNTGLTVDEIISEFNNGDVINATKALEIGFLDSITTFKSLLSELNAGNMPNYGSQKNSETLIGVDNSKQGKAMTVEEQLAEALATIEANQTAIVAFESQVETLTTANTAFEETVATLTSDAQSARDELATVREVATHSITAGLKMGASSDTLLAMIEANSVQEASNILVTSKNTDGASFNGDVEDGGTSEKAESEQLEAKCASLGVTFVK